MASLLLVLAAVFVVSLISFVGAAAFVIKRNALDKLLFYFVSFAAGTMLAAAFLDLLPEAISSTNAETALSFALFGVFAFFVLERAIHWHHYHRGGDAHPYTYLNLVGDGVHNFIDGLAIAASFASGTQIGFATTIAVIAHEIPQELGDFGVLIYGGLSKAKAIALNFLTALTAVVGALFGYYSTLALQGITPLLISFAAGGFLYVSAADLVPELHKERKPRKIVSQTLLFLGGIALIWFLKKWFGE